MSSILDVAGVQIYFYLLSQFIKNTDYLWADKFQRLIIILVSALTLLLSDLGKWNWFIWNHTRTLAIFFWRMDKMFVKGQDCVSHTLEIIDKNPWYNGQSLFQGRNREFFDALNYSTSIKSECFFKNQGIFFNLFLKTGSTPPCYLRPIVTQEIIPSIDYCLCNSCFSFF